MTEQIDTDTAIGKFFLTMIGALAQMEREQIAERTKATLDYKKQQGESLGRIPYGYDRVDGKLVADPGEQKVIRRIKRWRKDGKSYEKIARMLNQEEIPSRIAQWHDSSVWYLLNKAKKKKRKA